MNHKQDASTLGSLLRELMNLVFKGDKFNVGKAIFLLVCTLGGLAYIHREDVSDFLIKVSRSNTIEDYKEVERARLSEKKEAAIINSSQSIYSVLRPDAVMVYFYKPEDRHQYRALYHYEGELPKGATLKDFSRLGVDKTSEEYSNHIMGIPYHSGEPIPYDHFEGVKRHFYNCPIFNRRLMYVGHIGMYWMNKSPVYNEFQFFSQCTVAARQIGMTME